MVHRPESTTVPQVRDGQRRLAAIVFTDIVGYSALVHRDDANALKLVNVHFALVRAIAPGFEGRVIKTIGDSVHLEFGSAQAATMCAVAIQQRHQQRNAQVPEEQRFEIRIGIHLGDVDHSGGDIYGDGVNIAARLQPLAPVGGIAISDHVRGQLREELRRRFTSRGPQELKNIATPLEMLVIEADAIAQIEAGPAITAMPAPAAAPRAFPVRAALGALAIVVAFAIGLTVFWTRGGTAPAPVDGHNAGPPPDASQPALAVLPFANTSGDPANEYFSDGLSEELINTLARVGNLKVIGRTSSFKFKNSQDDAGTIGQKLGVGYLVDGSVRKAADRVRIAISLVRTADGASLWSDSYDRELKDIFAVQSEIATAVAGQLQRSLGISQTGLPAGPSEIGKPPSGNVEAYQALLQGNFYVRRNNASDSVKGIELYEKAVALDPAYALAFAQLAIARIQYGSEYTYSAGAPEVLAKARAAAETALRLDPNLAQAHLARGLEHELIDLRFKDAEKEYRRAAELAPNDPAVQNQLGAIQFNLGSAGPALAAFDRAIALDPLFLRARSRRAYVLELMGRYDEAEATLREALEIEPQAAQTHSSLALVKMHQGDTAAAITLAEQEPDAFWRLWSLNLVLPAHGDRQAADAALEKIIRDYGNEGAYQIAEIYAQRKDPDAVFKWLDHALATHDTGITQLYTSTFLVAYRDDPRFATFARKVGLDPAAAPFPPKSAGSKGH